MSRQPVSETLDPTSIEDLAEAVRAHNNGAIYPVGAGSWMDLGYPRTKPGIEISTLQLNRVVDYPHEELTITVEAGILISELSKILAEKGQMLPFDCPYPEKAALGGLLATNTSGPRRLAYGTARDSVIGLDVVNAQGERIHGGGRVVKNVAGYDMPKMHIGALGTLGIIVEATIKVRPMPESSQAATLVVGPPRLHEACVAIQNAKLRPVAVEVESPNELGGEYFTVQLFFEDSREAVANQMEHVAHLPDCFVRLPNGKAEQLLERFLDGPSSLLQESTNRMAYQTTWLTAKLSLRPTETARAMSAIFENRNPWKIKAHALNGVIWVFWRASDVDEAKQQVNDLRRIAADHRGFASLLKCRAPWKRELPIWGDLGPEIEWMRRLRNSLDPNHVLNPGRFVVE